MPWAFAYGSSQILHQNNLLSERKQEVDADQLKDVLRDFIKDSVNNFRSYRGGSGRKIEDSIVYPSSLRVPGASTTSIWVSTSESRSYVRAELYKGSRDQSERIYSEYINKLKAAYPQVTGRARKYNSETSEGSYYSIEPNQNIKATVEIGSTCARTGDRCRVNLTVRAPEDTNAEELSNREEISEATDMDFKGIAQEVAVNLVKIDYEAVRKDFNEQLQASLSAEKLAQAWAAIVLRFGAFQRQLEAVVGKNQGFDTVYIKCQMEGGLIMIEVVFDKKGRIGGLWMRPI
jgi:hypothetical protein